MARAISLCCFRRDSEAGIRSRRQGSDAIHYHQCNRHRTSSSVVRSLRASVTRWLALIARPSSDSRRIRDAHRPSTAILEQHTSVGLERSPRFALASAVNPIIRWTIEIHQAPGAGVGPRPPRVHGIIPTIMPTPIVGMIFVDPKGDFVS